ncbi:MAG TPA: HAD-IC family P-type ATPase [Dehalococcoidia bacterium]|nr:HAD-IC family P-type ATPase [Dehalococcoidia bacterium]
MTSPAESAAGALAGLTSAEAQSRAAAGQSNAVAWTTSRSIGRIIVDNAASPINIVLFVIAFALVALQLFGDAVLTGGLVAGNIVAAVFQEIRAKRQLDRIALLNRPVAKVIRDGAEREIPGDEIVLGDYVSLEPGDQVLTDGDVVSASGLGVDESLLTGESDILMKNPGDKVVSGSYCMAGSGVYETTRVGGETMANQITARARQHRMPTTPLQREVGLVLWSMSLVMVFLGVFVVRDFFQGDNENGLNDAVRAAAVIVALVPQGLAVMVTVSYAMAAVRLGGSGVLIQRMNAVESISHVNVLCLDKTGTLTTNRLTVKELKPFEMEQAELEDLLGSFAASASFSNRTSDAIREAFPREARGFADEVAFDSERKWSGLVFDAGGDAGTYVLGAPDIVGKGMDEAESIAEVAEESTVQGLRVLLLARSGQTRSFAREDDHPRLPDDLEPLGLVILRDETRQDAPAVIAEFAEAGIDLKVISGDHPDTVAALARQAGMPLKGEPANGQKLETMSDEELQAAVGQSTIFGRVSPATKERIVTALRKSGRYVAMIGDGVNDVPALKAAQLAVGLRSGSAITRDIADMVLMNDAFSNLPRAFREGQRIRKGMENTFRVFLTRTLSLTLVILAVALMDDPFPVTPRHTALIAMLTVGIPAFFLAAWARPGRTGQVVILSASQFVVPAAISIAVVGLVVYQFFLSASDDVALAQTALTLTAIGCGLLVILFLEPPTQTWVAANPLTADWRPAAMAAGLFGLLIAFIAVGTIREFYELDMPNVWETCVIVLIVIAWAVCLREIWRLPLFKALARRLNGSAALPAKDSPSANPADGDLRS